jgi:acetyltransferase
MTTTSTASTKAAAASAPSGPEPQQHHPLDAIFLPRSVAMIGATETIGSVGQAIMRNLTLGSFRGRVVPVNPKRATVMGLPAVPRVRDIEDGPIDLAVIAVPAVAVPQVLEECADAGIRGVVIISAGFKETGPAGVAAEARVLSTARRAGMRIVGPNCLGVMNPHVGLNATFAASAARPGNVAFISQSGALCTAVLDWSFQRLVGFSAFVSVGSMLDVGWGDLVDYFGDDPHTKSIVLYMESIGDARSFLSAAREVAMEKPIVVLKVGRTAEASRAAASHTGALTGSDEVLDAALRRVGALRVNTISEMFDMVDVLTRQPRPAGPRLTIVTNAGGPGVLATDMLVSGGGELAPLPAEAVDELNKVLPPHWSHANPIDILGDAGADQYLKAVQVATKNPQSDGTLIVLTPQAITSPTTTAQLLAPLAKSEGKPILASWMGGDSVSQASRILNDAGIPTFEFPDAAARAFCYMWRYSSSLDAIYQTPELPPDTDRTVTGRAQVAQIVSSARDAGRTLLDEHDSKQVLAAYGIPTVETLKASTVDDAVAAARRLGFPVVLKLLSATITHKTDVGGVKLNLRDAAAVSDAFDSIKRSICERFGSEHFSGVTIQPMIGRGGYELILGSSLDPQFGPVLLFGTGGVLVEILKDRAIGLPPLNTTLARRMMEGTKIYRALKGVRGARAADLPALEQYLVRFSQLVVENPWIKEIDINPLLVSAERIVALDARVILHAPDVKANDLPHTAIRPYPTQYVGSFHTRDGAAVTIRPVRPEDEPLMIQFHHTLSEQAVRQRYFGAFRLSERISHKRLRRTCFNDFDREIVLVVDRETDDGRHEILGVARLSKDPGMSDAEFAIVIATPWQSRGLGTELTRRLVAIARDEHVMSISACVLPENMAMVHVLKKAGFDVGYNEGESVWKATQASTC